ncbi:MAG: hypothetical protein M0Z95_14080 [Actinomycetota bacterium]|jgi:hypothetical protein|nr:hypothetical protein [Actinomycetota bacterium]
MVDVLRIMLAVLVAASLTMIVAYVVVFLGMAAWTVFTSPRRDQLAEDLDRALAEIVGPRVPTAPPAKPSSYAGSGGLRRPGREGTGLFRVRKPA